MSTSGWPTNAMTFYLSGVLAGIDLGRASERAEVTYLHDWAFANVHAAARLPELDLHRDVVRARQVASCEAQKREAVPWPDEGPP